MSHQAVGRGGTITLDATYSDGAGNLIDPTDPRVDIINADNVEVLANQIPTKISTGRYSFDYTVAGDAMLGSWTAHWTGTINSVLVEDDDHFDVSAAGSVEFPSADMSLICASWADTTDVCSPCDDYDFDQTLLEDCIQAASEVLFELSARQFSGLCQATVRPCARRIDDKPYVEHRVGAWQESWGFCSCNRSDKCGCSRLSEVTLGAYPVQEIVQVKVDGEVLDSSLYRLDESRYLVRLPDADGSRPAFPCCQRLDLADSEEETWSVTFTYGTAPPISGRRAAAALGCELAISCSPETTGKKCRLPKRVTNVARQGISMVVLDPFDFLDEGKTGVYEVDLFLKAVNPHKLRRRSTVLSPDLPSRVRRVGA